MFDSEFDKFAEHYHDLHAKSITVSGERPDYFAEYKVRDLCQLYFGHQSIHKKPCILDFGAGVGASTPYFRKYFPESSLYCLDSSRNSLVLAKSRFEHDADFVAFDGRRIPFNEFSFEIVFVACVLHHVAQEEHSALLSELRRVLKPRGLIMIYEHNPYNPLTLRAVSTCPFDEHARLIRPAAMKGRLKSNGFRDILTHYRVFFPNALRSLRSLEKLIKWIPIGAQYCISARR